MSAVPLRNNKASGAVRSVSGLGATGSIGDSTMDLLRASKDRYRVEALTAHTNVQALAKLAREFGARYAAVADPSRLSELKDALAGTRTECGAGESAVVEAAARPADWVMAAVSGAAGVKPALAAVDRGATVALANKECLVCAGDFFMQRAARAGAASCPPIPSTMPCSRPWDRETGKNWSASSSPPRGARSGPGPAPISSRRRWRRR